MRSFSLFDIYVQKRFPSFHLYGYKNQFLQENKLKTNCLRKLDTVEMLGEHFCLKLFNTIKSGCYNKIQKRSRDFCEYQHIPTLFGSFAYLCYKFSEYSLMSRVVPCISLLGIILRRESALTSEDGALRKPACPCLAAAGQRWFGTSERCCCRHLKPLRENKRKQICQLGQKPRGCVAFLTTVKRKMYQTQTTNT